MSLDIISSNCLILSLLLPHREFRKHQLGVVAREWVVRGLISLSLGVGVMHYEKPT